MLTEHECFLTEKGFEILKATVSLYLNKEERANSVKFFRALPVYPFLEDCHPQPSVVMIALTKSALKNWTKVIRTYIDLVCFEDYRTDADVAKLWSQEDKIKEFFSQYCAWLSSRISTEGYITSIDVEAKVQRLLSEI